MNLLDRPINKPVDLMQYRLAQYNLIPEFISVCFDYASRFGLICDDREIQILNDDSYHYTNHYAFDKYRVRFKGEKKNFLELDIPTLIDDTFFKLKGVYYMPLIYILDEPIAFKKNSIKITSLFKPITLYTNDNRMIIDGNNIPISRFLRIYESDETIIEKLCEQFKTQYVRESQDESVFKLSNTLGLVNDVDVIHSYIEDVFFDKWTKDLYSAYYDKKDVSMLTIFEIILSRLYSNENSEFNDLNYKRLVFIELLLDPLFKAFNKLMMKLQSNELINQVPIKANAIIQHFYSSGNSGIGSSKMVKGLSGNNLYSVVNGYTGLLGLKASLENPKSQSELPRSVSSIHPTYKNKICPVTISNKNPGVVSSLVPNQKIDLRYGKFLN